MAHSDRTDVVLLHKHFSSWLSIFCNSVSIITNCIYATISKSNITAYVNNWFTLFKSVYYVQFLFNTDFFCWFFIYIALRDVDLHISLILVTNTNAVEGGTTSAGWLYYQHNQSKHMLAGVAVMSSSASFQNKTTAATDHVSQRALNWKLSRKFKKWYKFSSHVKEEIM